MNPPLKPRLRLRDKLLFAVALLVVVLTGAILLILSTRIRSEEDATLLTDIQRTFSVFESFVSSERENLRDKAVLMSGLPRLTAALDVKKPKFADMANTVSELCLDLSDSVKAPPLFIVTDKKGNILYDSHHPPQAILDLRAGKDPAPGPEPTPLPAGGWPNIQAALSGKDSQGAFLYVDPGAAKPVTTTYQAVTYPIFSPGRNILGALVLGFSLDKELAEHMKQMTKSEIAFLVRDRVMASTWPEDKSDYLAGQLKPFLPTEAMWKEKSLSPYTPISLGNEEYRAEFAPIKDSLGTAIGSYAILRSEDQALAFQKNLQQTIVIIGVGGVTFAIVMALFIARRITHPLTALLSGVQEVGKGNLQVQVKPETHDELGVLARSFNDMIQGLREKERVTNILGKYISPEVAKKVLGDTEGLALRGERRECVVMFTDIRGFTAFSENMAPEKLVKDLNEYFTLMVDVVFKYEGTLDKFIGDAIMAVWGAPVPFEDKELRAVKAALDMQYALGQYNKARIDRNQPPLTMGVGLNSGVVVSGNLGSDKRTDYTVIGEEVNLASRLCSKAAPGQVLISESMFRKLKGLVEMRALEPIVLKGFSEAVKVYEVTGLSKS
ncbi:MAG TPA: adenylate/guanylate cyclase domain-containing protein [bacterium]|nr:adenylate/guanylate cyclase domain-containing protein [bacterium]